MIDFSSKLKDRTIVRGEAYKNLVKYLDFHEFDIADGVNDFDELKPVFIQLFGREPKGY